MSRELDVAVVMGSIFADRFFALALSVIGAIGDLKPTCANACYEPPVPEYLGNLASLELVYPPITNREAEWLKHDAEVVEILKTSHLYMIAQRREVEIIFAPIDPGDTYVRGALSFKGDLSISPFEIHFGDLIASEKKKPAAIIETSQKFFRLWSGNKKKLLLWFTVDKLLFDKWRGVSYVTGLDDYRKFTQYKLHYVGESADRDTFRRLLKDPHPGRLAVLSSEYQMSPTAAISDEVTLLMFRLPHISMHSPTIEEIESAEFDIERQVVSYSHLVKDAERAYINIAKSKYNKKAYKEYPKGKDTLFSQGFDWHGYVINEDVSMQTDTAIIVGGYSADGPCSNDADLICVQDGGLTFVKASQLAELDRLRREQVVSA